ncbi:MAG: DUF6893 family small protein [Jatrophihabitantaceae bacterium]
MIDDPVVHLAHDHAVPARVLAAAREHHLEHPPPVQEHARIAQRVDQLRVQFRPDDGPIEYVRGRSRGNGRCRSATARGVHFACASAGLSSRTEDHDLEVAGGRKHARAPADCAVDGVEGVSMETVGIIATVLAGLVVLFGLVLFVISVPDIRRYFKIRAM